MTEQKINKSDYTDRKGVVHDSVGENIRSDNNQLSADYLNSMGEEERNMFPFFPFKNARWETITDTITASGQHETDIYHVEGGSSQLVLDEQIKFIIVLENDFSERNGCIASQGVIEYANKKRFNIFFLDKVTSSDAGKSITFLALIGD
jgi:hypothetical protein